MVGGKASKVLEFPSVICLLTFSVCLLSHFEGKKVVVAVSTFSFFF